MKVIEGLIQGSPAWHAHRLAHFNASDAPAMMGCSPYRTRAQLIKETATGLAEEVDAQTQRLFDDGHRTEALARPIAEQIVGQELFPVVATNGPLSASFDGVTMDDRIDFECKRLNKRLRDSMVPGCTGADLPMDYQVQMEQQHAVNDAAEKTLFVAAQFDDEGNLVEERHCWYTPNAELRAQILAGWKQFEADVAAYRPAEVVPAVVAEPVQALPAVLVKVTGEIAITANFGAFETALRDFLENRLIREPKTDQDFADLDTQIKAMKGAEAALDAAETQMLAQIQTVDTAKKTKDMLAALVRTNRLMAEKLLASEKERRKAEIVADGQAKLREHISALTRRTGVAIMGAGDFAGVIKGKKNLASMEDAISTELARCKIESNRIADLIDENRRAMDAAEAGHLFPDFTSVCTKAAEDFAAQIVGRKAQAAATLEKEREKIRAEEAEKLAREAQAKAAEAARIEREQRAAAEAAAREAQAKADEAARVEREAAASAAAAAAVAQQNTPAQAPENVVKAEAATPDATDPGTPASTSPSVGSMGAGQATDVAPSVAPAPQVRAFVAPAAAPSMRLGEIQAAIAPLSITAEGLAQLGFPAHVERGLKLYPRLSLPLICKAMREHLLTVANQQKAA